MPSDITVAALNRLSQLAPMFGRPFTHEPMMRWPRGKGGDLVERFAGCFAFFLEAVRDVGAVWEVGDADGAAAWVAPASLGSGRRSTRGTSRGSSLRALTAATRC